MSDEEVENVSESKQWWQDCDCARCGDPYRLALEGHVSEVCTFGPQEVGWRCQVSHSCSCAHEGADVSCGNDSPTMRFWETNIPGAEIEHGSWRDDLCGKWDILERLKKSLKKTGESSKSLNLIENLKQLGDVCKYVAAVRAATIAFKAEEEGLDRFRTAFDDELIKERKCGLPWSTTHRPGFVNAANACRADLESYFTGGLRFDFVRKEDPCFGLRSGQGRFEKGASTYDGSLYKICRERHEVLSMLKSRLQEHRASMTSAHPGGNDLLFGLEALSTGSMQHVIRMKKPFPGKNMGILSTAKHIMIACKNAIKVAAAEVKDVPVTQCS